MVEHQHGLTVMYNKLKDASCTDGAIQELRSMHEEMDRAVLHAYGWDDIKVPPFSTPTTPSGRKALEAFEDEVIDRLFALNAVRAQEERNTVAPKASAPRKEKKAPTDKREPEFDFKDLKKNKK